MHEFKSASFISLVSLHSIVSIEARIIPDPTNRDDVSLPDEASNTDSGDGAPVGGSLSAGRRIGPFVLRRFLAHGGRGNGSRPHPEEDCAEGDQGK